MKKNVAGQSTSISMLTAADGADFTGTVTVYVTGDNGTQAIGSVGAGVCTHEGNGLHSYAPSQAETNYDYVDFTFIGTGAVSDSNHIYTSFPQSVDNATGIAAIPAAVWAVGTRTLTSFGTLIADIWANVSRTLTDKTGFFISGVKTTLDDLNDLSSDDIAALFAGQLASGVLVNGLTITDDEPIETTRGDKKTITINLGSQWPMTGKLVYFIIKKKATDDNSTAIVNRQVDSIIDAANGIAQIILLPTETTPVDCYNYEVELRDDPGDDNPQTALRGELKINQDVRQ